MATIDPSGKRPHPSYHLPPPPKKKEEEKTTKRNEDSYRTCRLSSSHFQGVAGLCRPIRELQCTQSIFTSILTFKQIQRH
jgi:hypothetical protein